MKSSRKFSILIIIIIIVGLASYLFYKEGTLPVNKDDLSAKIFVIQKGESLDSIARRLEKEDLIRSRLVFYIVTKKLGIDKNVQAGDFRLSQSMDTYKIAKNLTHGTLDKWITIIEGLRKEEIAQIFSKDFDIPETEFLKYAKEGYLFPDTYLIQNQATAESIISILQSNFDKKYSKELRQKARQKKLTDNEVVIIASMVEKEAKLDSDRNEIASIILKRYRNDWPLQIDATIQYVLGYQSQERTWWKKNLSQEDLEINSLYNTYKNKGLPPTPISNPGEASIIAIVNANENTPYWFYISDKKGKIHYSITHEEQQANIKKYLQ